MTPSSKCVGDLALYLVTRGLKAADVIDPAKKGQVDFPDSVVALLEGRLGFPHTGFPEEVRRNSTHMKGTLHERDWGGHTVVGLACRTVGRRWGVRLN